MRRPTGDGRGTPPRGVLTGLAVLAALVGLLGVAGASAPAARAAGAAPDGEGPFTVRTEENVKVGTPARIEVSSDRAGSGTLRIAVASTLGEGKGLPKDKRVWQTRAPYDGKPVIVTGPYLRVGEYRVKVWFVADGSTAGESRDPQATTAFRVLTVDGHQAAGAAGAAEADVSRGTGHATKSDEGDGGALWWVLLGLVVLVGAGTAGVLVSRRRGAPAPAGSLPGVESSAPGRRRRTEVPDEAEPEPDGRSV